MKKLNILTSRQSEHLTTRDWSRYGLDTLRKSIDNKHLVSLKIKQEIKLQKENSAKFVQKIKRNVHKKEQNAIQFATKLEQQIQKNKYLNTLVYHYEAEISKIKQKQYQNLMNNVQNSEYQELRNQIQVLEKELGEQARKANSAVSQVQKKYQIVKSQRRQRTVFSNMFNNFQNQLFDLELHYKQLVIQRFLWGKKYEQKVEQFQMCNIQGQKKLKNYQQRNRERQCQQQFQLNALNKIENNSIFFRTRNKLPLIKLQKVQNNRQSQQIQNQLKTFQKQKIVKQILFDFKANNIDQLSRTIKDLTQSNNQIFDKIQNQNQNISQLQDKIKTIRSCKKNRSSDNNQLSQIQQKRLKKTNNLKKKLNQYIKFNELQNKNFQKLMQSQQLQKLAKIIGCQTNNQQILIQIFTKLDTQLNQITLNMEYNSKSPLKMYKSRIVQQFQLFDRDASKLPFQSQSTLGNFNNNDHQKYQQQIQKSRKKSSVSRIRHKQKQQQHHTQKKLPGQSIKKLSNMIKQASNKTKNNFHIASKNQMIKYGLKMFQTEGQECSRILSNFKVQYI